MIIVSTNWINVNEKAYDYVETHEQSPDNSGFVRVRKIYVNRDGNLAEYRENMGKALLFKGAKQLHIPSLWEHTVAELINLGDELRWETEIDIKDWLEIDNYNAA